MSISVSLSIVYPIKIWRITFLGAESVVFTLNLLGDIFSFPEFAEAKIALMDIDPERLRIAEIMAHKVAASLNAHPKITTYADRKAALEGADYAINTILVGGSQATLIDFDLPKRYGLQQTIADSSYSSQNFENFDSSDGSSSDDEKVSSH